MGWEGRYENENECMSRNHNQVLNKGAVLTYILLKLDKYIQNLNDKRM